jgi:hypothetical protein
MRIGNLGPSGTFRNDEYGRSRVIISRFFIGLPLLCLAIVVGYLVHRNQIKKIQNQTGSPNRDAYTSYSDTLKDFLIHPDSFF